MISTAHRIIHHPYISSGVAIARVTVCVATLLWGLIVILIPGTLSAYASSAVLGINKMNSTGHWFLGMLAILVGTYQMAGVVNWCKQTLLGEATSLLMVLLWTTMAVGVWFYQVPIPASGAACISVVTLLSWWNLVAPPKRIFC